MSIAADTQKALRSFRSLIGFAMRRVFFIKDLKDLENGPTRVAIDMQDLKDLKRCFLRMRSRGTGPRATVKERQSPFHRRARACPSPCTGLPDNRGGQAPALR